MAHLTDKIILLIIAFFLQLRFPFSIYSVTLFLIGFSLTLALTLWRKSWLIMLALFIFVITCWYDMHLLPYLSLLTYDIYDTEKKWYILPLLSFPFFYIPVSPALCLMSIVTQCIAIILKEKFLTYKNMSITYKKQRDATKELSMLLEEKHHDLLVKQDYEIRLATLNERNRIAREIHDNVGHLLSSALLQVGALQAINQQTTLQAPFHNLHDTLNQAMSSVRNSVHDLHEHALDLHMEIQKLLKEFTFCQSKLAYDLSSNLKQEVIYQILAIIKEALHNVVKHSNANIVSIILREHPSFIQLIIEDNGTKQSSIHFPGIGLHNMQQRVDLYHGYLNINTQKGYQIFITLPKEEIL